MLLIRLRQILIIALLCSNMVLGLLSYQLLKQSANGYTELVGRSIPILADLHDVALTVMRSYRATGQALLSGSPAERQDWVGRAYALEQKSATMRDRYQKSPDLINGSEVDQPLEAASEVYRTRLNQFSALIEQNKLTEAVAYRTGPLRVAVDDYCDLVDNRIQTLEKRARQLDHDLTQSHQTWRNLLLALGSWPLIAAIGSLVLGLGMLAALLVSVFTPAFRSRQT